MYLKLMLFGGPSVRWGRTGEPGICPVCEAAPHSPSHILFDCKGVVSSEDSGAVHRDARVALAEALACWSVPVFEWFTGLVPPARAALLLDGDAMWMEFRELTQAEPESMAALRSAQTAVVHFLNAVRMWHDVDAPYVVWAARRSGRRATAVAAREAALQDMAAAEPAFADPHDPGVAVLAADDAVDSAAVGAAFSDEELEALLDFADAPAPTQEQREAAEGVAASVGLELHLAVAAARSIVSGIPQGRGMLDPADLQLAGAYLAGAAPEFESRFRQLAASLTIPLDDLADAVLGSQHDLVPGAPPHAAPPPAAAMQGHGGSLRPTTVIYQQALNELQLPPASAALAADRLHLAAFEAEEVAALLDPVAGHVAVNGDSCDVEDD